MATATTYTKPYRFKTYPYIDPTQPHLSTAGKTVLVTGGGYGIGAGIARSFALSSASNVVIVGRTLSKLNETKAKLEAEFPNTKFHAFAGDIVDVKTIEEIFSTVASTIAPVDILINNAAFLPTTSPIETADLENWWKGFEVNVLGTTVVTRAFLKNRPGEIGQKNGIVINLNTSVSHCGIFPGYSSYAGSKMATLRIMESFQAENPGVRFISTNPGGVDTDMYAKFKMPPDFEMTDIGLPSDMSVWMASDEADFLKGRMVWQQWDAEDLVRKKDVIVKEEELQTGLKGIVGSLY